MSKLFGYLCATLMLAALLLAAPPPVSGQDPLFRDDFEVDKTPIERHLSVSPGALLLTDRDDSAVVQAQLTDADGQALNAPLHWRSSDPAIVRVDATGTVTAMSDLGSATVTVSAPGALPASVTVTVADPVDDAQLISDTQVLSEPEAVDPNADYRPGFRYRVTLDLDPPPAVGELLLGVGDTPLGGRVVAVTSSATGTVVTLELVTPDELFDRLDIRQTLTLERAAFAPNPQLASLYDVQRLADGTLRLLPRAATRRATGPVGTATTLPFADCTTGLTNPEQIFRVTSEQEITLTPNLSLEVDYQLSNGGLRRLALSGQPAVLFDLRPRVLAAFEGKFSCKVELGRLLRPFPGYLGLILSGSIPLGVGFELNAKVSLAEPLGVNLTASGQADVITGFTCVPTCQALANASATFDTTLNWVLPPESTLLGDALQLDLGAHGFLYAEIGLATPIDTLGFSAFEVKAGVQQSGTFRSRLGQARDDNYAAEFKFELLASAGATSDVTQLFELVNIVPPNLTLFTQMLPLEQSPRGTLTITDPNGGSSATPANPARVRAGTSNQLGELATFTVDLDPSHYLAQYAIDEVSIYRRVGSGASAQLVPNRPGCHTLQPTSVGQKRFQCQTDFLSDDTGSHSFVAFVNASILGVSVPFPLEIAPNSAAELGVFTAKIAFTARRTPSSEVYVMNTDGSEQHSVTPRTATDNLYPALSPLGNKIAFVSRRDANSEIYVMYDDGSDQTRLTDHPSLDQFPAWSSDGHQIVWESERDGNSDIYLMNSNGSGKVNLTRNPAADKFPAWSPIGNKIAFTSNRNGNDEIYLMNPDGSSPINLSRHPASDSDPAWSPDGKQLVFTSSRDGNNEIYTMNVDGSMQVNISNHSANDSAPIWSTDGAKIVFTSDRDGNLEIYMMNPDGSDQTNLTRHPGPDTFPHCRG